MSECLVAYDFDAAGLVFLIVCESGAAVESLRTYDTHVDAGGYAGDVGVGEAFGGNPGDGVVVEADEVGVFDFDIACRLVVGVGEHFHFVVLSVDGEYFCAEIGREVDLCAHLGCRSAEGKHCGDNADGREF